MYSTTAIKRGLRSPRLVFKELNRKYYRRLDTRQYNPSGLDVMAADWDNLLILDACRYDLFERVNTLPGELEPVASRGSATREFIAGNFTGREMFDTVYVTASPMLYRHFPEVYSRFHAVVDVWRDYGWDEESRTVLPETVAEATLEAASRYPDKRLLIHFLQPHYPFLGPTGREHFDLDRLDFQWDDVGTDAFDIPADVVREAYEENLEVVLPTVESLVDSLGGKTVVTSDHGQALGERGFPFPYRTYGHPSGIYMSELVTVPWLTMQNGPRREVVVADPTEEVYTTAGEDTDVAQERLRHLGYME